MPVYDFSGGINALNQGIGSLGESLKTANQQTQSTALASALARGDWDGAMQAAAAAGDTNTVLKLRELKQSGDQAAAFGPLADKILGGLGYGGTGGAGTGTATSGAGTGTATSGAAGNPPNYNPAIVEAKIRAKAQELNMDPDVAARVFGSEGKSGYYGDKDATGNYTSFGPLMFHYKTGGGGMGNVGGMGDQFTAATGLNARDPSTIDQQIDFGLRQAKQHGWGQWYGAAKVGISPWQGINATTTRSEAAAPVAVAGGNRPPDTADAVYRSADGTTYAGPNAARDAGPGGAPLADVPSAGAAPVSGTYPQLVSNAPLPPVRPAGLGDSLAPPQPADPALAQFLASHVGGADVAARLLQAPPGTPTGSIVPPGLLPQDDAVKPAGQFIAEAKQALAGGMAHGTPQILSPEPVAPAVTPPPPAAAPSAPAPLTAAAPAIPRPTPIYPYGSTTPAVGMPPPAASTAAAAPPVAAPVAAPAPAAAPADIAAIERTMPAVQQQAASVGGGQVNDAGMAAASALTSGQPVPQGLGASLQAPVMQALSQGGAPAALTQGPLPAAAPPPAIAALPPSVAVDASGSTPPAEAPGVTAATPPPAAAAPAPAIEVPGYEGRYTRAQSDDSEGNPSQAEWDKAAKEQGIGAAPAPPIDAKLPPTPAAVKAGDPVVTAAAPISPPVARSLAQTRPGSDQRMMLFALLMRAAANSGPQSAGNVKFVEGLMAIEKQHQEDFGKTLRTVSDAELASLGYTKAPGSVVQADPWGNLKVTAPGAEPAGHIMSDAEVAANNLGSVTGTGRVWWQPGKPGEKPVAIDAPADSKVVPITDDQKKLYPGALGMYEGGRDAGKPFYPPGPQVAIQGESDFMKSMNKRIQTSYDQTVTGSVPRLITLNRMQDSINKGVISGWGPAQQQAQNVAAIFAKLGFGDASKIGNTQEFLLSAAKDYVQTAKGAFPQRITNADIIVSKLMSGLDLSFTEETLQKAIQWQREDALHQIQQHNKDVGNYINSASSDAEKRMAQGLIINPDDLPVPVAPVVQKGAKGSGFKPNTHYIFNKDGTYTETPASQ